MNDTSRLADTLKGRAYALGRRSSLARAIVARLRRLRSAALGRRSDFIAGELAALIAFLRESGCSFHSCTALGANPKPLGISFRYDVHVRDIAACHAFVEAHRIQKVPASFFLFWDYSGLERSYMRRFRAVAADITLPSEIGLHDSPVDAHLVQSRFRFDRGAYWAWLNSPDAVAWITALARDRSQLDAFNAAVLKSFVSRVRATQESFGSVASIAAHGGDLRRALLPKLGSLGQNAAEIGRSLCAPGWLTPERVAAADLVACVDNYSSNRGKWRQITDRGGGIRHMVQRLQIHLTQKNAIQILLHPFTWDGATRDGELSQLLNTGRAIFRE